MQCSLCVFSNLQIKANFVCRDNDCWYLDNKKLAILVHFTEIISHEIIICHKRCALYIQQVPEIINFLKYFTITPFLIQIRHNIRCILTISFRIQYNRMVLTIHHAKRHIWHINCISHIQAANTITKNSLWSHFNNDKKYMQGLMATSYVMLS